MYFKILSYLLFCIIISSSIIANANKYNQKLDSGELQYRIIKLETKINDLEKTVESMRDQLKIIDKVQNNLASKLDKYENGDKDDFYKSNIVDNEKEFTYGYDMLQEGKYEKAKRAFDLFIEKYPEDSKVGEAYFWLGEISYKAKDYTQASRNYLISYRDYENSTRRNDSLFKLGIVLGLLGKKDEACSALNILINDTPTVNKSLRKKSLEEEINIGCRN